MTTGVLKQIAHLSNVTMGNQLSLIIRATDNVAYPAYTILRTILTIDHPILSSGNVLGSTIDLTYSNLLDPNSVPSPGDYIVSVNGSINAVTDVRIVGQHVLLTITTPIVLGNAVALVYIPGGNKIKDMLGAIASASITSPLSLPNSLAGTFDNSFVE